MIRRGANDVSAEIGRAVMQRRPLGMQDGVGLRDRFGEHEEDHDVEHDADDDADDTEVAGDDPGERGLDGLADVDGEEHRVDPALRLHDEAQQRLARLVALIGERRGLRPRHPGEAHLRHGEEDQHEEQDDDDHDHGDVRLGERRRDHRPAPSAVPSASGTSA